MSLINTSLLKNPFSWVHLALILLIIAFGGVIVAQNIGLAPAQANSTPDVKAAVNSRG